MSIDLGAPPVQRVPMFHHIPLDIQRLIFDYLNLHDLSCIRATSRIHRDLLQPLFDWTAHLYSHVRKGKRHLLAKLPGNHHVYIAADQARHTMEQMLYTAFYNAPMSRDSLVQMFRCDSMATFHTPIFVEDDVAIGCRSFSGIADPELKRRLFSPAGQLSPRMQTLLDSITDEEIPWGTRLCIYLLAGAAPSLSLKEMEERHDASLQVRRGRCRCYNCRTDLAPKFIYYYRDLVHWWAFLGSARFVPILRQMCRTPAPAPIENLPPSVLGGLYQALLRYRQGDPKTAWMVDILRERIPVVMPFYYFVQCGLLNFAVEFGRRPLITDIVKFAIGHSPYGALREAEITAFKSAVQVPIKVNLREAEMRAAKRLGRFNDMPGVVLVTPTHRKRNASRDDGPDDERNDEEFWGPI